MPALPELEHISLNITTLRGQRVILDSDLAALYGVETKRFNEAVKRNLYAFRLISCFSSPKMSTTV